MKEITSAGAVRNSSKKLHRNDILRKFASGKAVVSDCLRTLRIRMISVTLPFDSRKSRKLKRISQWIASDAHALYMAWAAPAVLLIRVVREPTWARYRRVCPRLLFLLIAIMPMAAVSQNSLHAKSTRTYKLKNSKTYNTMPQIIKVGGGLFSKGELLRINPSNNSIESSATVAVRGFPAARTLPTAHSVTCFSWAVRSLPPHPVASMSRPTPAAASRPAVSTAPTATSSTCRTRATPCSPTPPRDCTTPRMVEEAG